MDQFIFFLAGGAGALSKDIFSDNKLVMPKMIDGDLLLGFLGGLVIGGFAGIFVDHSLLTAFLGGFTGYQVLGNLIPKQTKK